MPRKEKKYHFIYKTTNVLTKKYYYGMHSTDNLEDGYLGSGKRLRYSIRKYGKENHIREIIEFCQNRNELKNRERELVNLNEIAKKDCINLCIGGKGGGFTPNQRKKGNVILKKRLKELKNDPDWCRKRFDNFSKARKLEFKLGKRKSIQEIYSWEGKKHTEETKRKIGIKNSIHQQGKNNSQYGTMWITNGKENKKIKKDEKIPIGWYKGRK